ncbi:hypothetical protein Q8A73_002584 [Channa argus]|nr:hypothetical protein Q8A73_002584 [Channa argus]
MLVDYMLQAVHGSRQAESDIQRITRGKLETQGRWSKVRFHRNNVSAPSCESVPQPRQDKILLSPQRSLFSHSTRQDVSLCLTFTNLKQNNSDTARGYEDKARGRRGDRGKESERRLTCSQTPHLNINRNQQGAGEALKRPDRSIHPFWSLDLLNEMGCLMKDTAVLDRAFASPWCEVMLQETPPLSLSHYPSSSFRLCDYTNSFVSLEKRRKVSVVFVKILIAQVSRKWPLRVLLANELPGRGSVVSPSNTGLCSEIKVTFPLEEMSQRDVMAEERGPSSISLAIK